MRTARNCTYVALFHVFFLSELNFDKTTFLSFFLYMVSRTCIHVKYNTMAISKESKRDALVMTFCKFGHLCYQLLRKIIFQWGWNRPGL